MREIPATSPISIGPGTGWGLDAAIVLAWDGEPLLWRDPRRVGGQLAIAGSRLPLETPLRAIAEGASLEEIAEDWPAATPEVVRRVIDVALRLLDDSCDAG